jgi:hypothetical protein
LRALSYFAGHRNDGLARAAAEPLRLHLTCPEFTYAPHSAGEVILKRRIAGFVLMHESAQRTRALAHLKIHSALRFNATLRDDAERIVAALGDWTYSGFHFRCEGDAAATWDLSCADARLNSDPLHKYRVPTAPVLYVATGDPDDLRYVDAAYRRVTKERYGRFVEKYGGALDVVAAIDALVLVRAKRFVGFDLSSFSYYVRWMRLVAGAPDIAGRDAMPPEYGRGGETHLVHLGDDGTLNTFELAFPT